MKVRVMFRKRFISERAEAESVMEQQKFFLDPLIKDERLQPEVKEAFEVQCGSLEEG